MTGTGKWIAGLFIACWFGVMSFGIVGHALKVGLCRNTLSYFVVWDMFCGWRAYDARTHLIAESSTGRYYAVREPWGEFCPFGNIGRIQYDVSNHLLPKQINHVLSHTQHEQIDHVYVVQEIWPKQFNMPERLWNHYYSEPSDKVSYFHLRAVCGSSGQAITVFPDWITQQTLNSIADNPRLQREVRQTQSRFSTLYTPVRQDQNRISSGLITPFPSTN